MGRFILYTLMAFTTAFVGVSWAARGFPIGFSRPSLVAPMRPTLDTTFGGENAKVFERKAWEAEQTAMSDKNPKLDVLRLDALQAANAYEMSPCDATMRSNLVAALTAYTRAWQNKLDCPRPLGMIMESCNKKLEEAAATFSTPLDIRVRAALAAAFDQKGIVRADFPPDVRKDMLQFTAPSFWNDESPICLPRQQASANPVR